MYGGTHQRQFLVCVLSEKYALYVNGDLFGFSFDSKLKDEFQIHVKNQKNI